jgi:peptidoglycan hydrolase CwlO-like protein
MHLNDAIFENIFRLASRIEESESKAQAAVAPLVNQIEQLSEQVEEVKARSIQSTAPVERAVTRLSERLEKIEAARQADTESRRWSLFSNNG